MGRVVTGLMSAMLVFGTLACGSSSSSSSGNPGGPSNPPPGAVATTTITISNNAVNPKNIVVSRGSQVTFTNNDSRNHTMNSDPHPEHTDCTEINAVGFITPGQSKVTGNLNTARLCGFHDHELNTVVGLQGTITIQ